MHTDLIGPSVEHEDNEDSRVLKTFLVQTLNGINNYVFGKDDKRLMLPYENVTQMSFCDLAEVQHRRAHYPRIPHHSGFANRIKKKRKKTIRKKILLTVRKQTMAQKLITPQIPDSFKGLLSNGKLVQNSILERTEKKVSLLESRQSVTLYSKSGTPPSLNHELDISSPNFIALEESYFIVQLKYSVKDNLNSSPRVHKLDIPDITCHLLVQERQSGFR